MKILRVQFNGRKGYWTVVEKSFNGAGGWKKFSDGIVRASNKIYADKILDELIDRYPENYKRDDD